MTRNTTGVNGAQVILINQAPAVRYDNSGSPNRQSEDELHVSQVDQMIATIFVHGLGVSVGARPSRPVGS